MINRIASACIRNVVAIPWSRKLLNDVYFKLSYSQKRLFHEKFSQIFRNKDFRGSDGTWEVIFHGKSILMPLTSKRMWLDWDTAVSIVGHDIEVKKTYEELISSSDPPELFIDIGANYGTHSLLFLVHQIETITFEPNTSCHNLFKEMCELNGVTPQLEAVALGELNGNVELAYPEHDTWFGSTDTEVTEELSPDHDLVTETVEQKTLDKYLPQIGHKKTVIKIDTEGNELAVLRGAVRTLHEIKPKVIFESWDDSERTELFKFFETQKYEIYETPWKPADESQPLKSDEFIASTSSNFIAV